MDCNALHTYFGQFNIHNRKFLITTLRICDDPAYVRNAIEICEETSKNGNTVK